jgi:hypothetical protein
MIGKRIGRLTVVRRAENTKDGLARWSCKCACGRKTIMTGVLLRSGQVKGCGCMVGVHLKKHHWFEGNIKDHPLHSVWQAMKSRCKYKSTRGFKYWGGKGVRVAVRWQKSFRAFVNDVGLPPNDGRRYTLERKDGSGDYTPGNVKWATYREQAQNKSNNRMLTFRGKTMCLMQWAREMNIPRDRLNQRIRKGWSVERALTEQAHETGARTHSGFVPRPSRYAS